MRAKTGHPYGSRVAGPPRHGLRPVCGLALLCALGLGCRGLGFRVWGLGFGVWGLGFRGLGVWGVGVFGV